MAFRPERALDAAAWRILVALQEDARLSFSATVSGAVAKDGSGAGEDGRYARAVVPAMHESNETGWTVLVQGAGRR